MLSSCSSDTGARWNAGGDAREPPPRAFGARDNAPARDRGGDEARIGALEDDIDIKVEDIVGTSPPRLPPLPLPGALVMVVERGSARRRGAADGSRWRRSKFPRLRRLEL